MSWPKLTYQAPLLTELGQMSDLTAGGSNGSCETRQVLFFTLCRRPQDGPRADQINRERP
jgi:hypothetical protein